MTLLLPDAATRSATTAIACDRAPTSTVAGRVAAWASVVCFTWHAAMLIRGLSVGSPGSPLLAVMALASALCLTCASDLWRGADRRTWRRMGALGVTGLALHLGMVMTPGHHTGLHTGTLAVSGHTTHAAHAGHSAAPAAAAGSEVGPGPGHWFALGPTTLQVIIALSVLSRHRAAGRARARTAVGRAA